MEAVSQVIVRNADRLQGPDVLLLNPAPDTLGRELNSRGLDTRASTPHHGVFRQLEALGLETRFEALPAIPASCQNLVMVLPREKDLLRMLLHHCATRMAADSTLWLVGENRSGIKSAARHLRDYFGSVAKVDNARHCVLLAARQPLECATFRIDDYLLRWQYDAPPRALKLASLPGVFAHGRVDQGTALLLHTLDTVPGGARVLDFACGNGIIGMSLLADSPDRDVTLLDVSALAMESARRSLELNGLAARLLPSDGLAELEGTFDLIISNPPFHRGVKSDLDIAARFFSESGTFLAEKGKIRVVFNQHLPYFGWLQDTFKTVETLVRKQGFDIVQASNPK